jgi:restriction endonuclease S subunit
MPDMLSYLGIEAVEKDEIKQFADRYSTVHSTEQDIFVVRTGGRNGLVLKGKKGVVGSTLYCLSPLWIDRDFLYYFLKLNEFQSSGERDLMNTFWNTPVPIVSLEKQKQIAKGIKEALSTFEQQNKELELKLIQSLRSSLVNVSSDTLHKIKNLDDFREAVIELATTEKLSYEQKKLLNENKSSKIALNKVGNLMSGYSVPEDKINYDGIGFPYIAGPEQLRENNITKWVKSHNRVVSEDSIFITAKGSSAGDVFRGIIGAAIGRDLHAFIPDTKILNIEYALLLFKSITKALIIKSQGVIPGIKKSDIIDFEVVIPSKEQQSEICDVVNTLFEFAYREVEKFENEKETQEVLQKSILSSFYKDLTFDENIDDVLSTIEAELDKKNIEISDLRKKQKQFRDSQSTLSKMKILEILKSSNTPVRVTTLWEKSKYQGNIDAFYEALKHEFDSNSIKWKLEQEDSEVPQSYISLT